MAVLGKNGLWALAIDLAVIFALYRQKAVVFKDDKAIDEIAKIAFRKQAKGMDKKTRETFYASKRAEMAGGKAYAKKYPAGEDTKAFTKAYSEAKWVR